MWSRQNSGTSQFNFADGLDTTPDRPLLNRIKEVFDMSKDSLTQELLKEQVSYDPKTGEFTRLVRSSNSVNVGDKAGCLNKITGYVEFSVFGTLHKAHRLAWLYVHGHFPPEQIDHINHDKADNRIDNLRLCTAATNSQNQTMYKNNSSGVTGVWRDTERKNWMVYISVRGKRITLGRREDINDAIALRKAAEKKYGFHRNHGKVALAA